MNLGVGDRLSVLRHAFKMTQSDVALKIGVTKVMIGRYEKGTARPSLEILLALADLFDTSTDYLLGRDMSKITTTPAIETLDITQKQLIKSVTTSLIELITE